MTRAPYAWAGGTAQDHAVLAWFSAAGPAQMGPRRAAFRSGLTAAIWAKGVALGLGAGLVVALLVLLAAPDGGAGAAFLGLVAVVLLVIAILVVLSVVARRYRHDVHAHGLVLSGPGGGVEVLPWATVDPGRVLVGASTRSMTRMPVALHRQRAVFAPAVVLNGWTNRPTGSHQAFEAFSSGYRSQPQASDSPFGWWQLGVTDPAAFLQAVEAAMVADGYPAAGLTPFALSRKVTARDLRRDPGLQRERLLTDPVIGLPRR